MNNMKPKKSLGQHWLKDKATLEQIAAEADLAPNDTVLEIGPGLGTLTQVLTQKAGKVIAVEFDPDLAEALATGLNAVAEVINADFLDFDLDKLPAGYKVVANIPYYITGKIIEKLLTAQNKPSIAVLLVQKEVAQRVTAQPGGDMSLLSVVAQYYSEVKLGAVVPASKFTPPPKVDSQVLILRPRNVSRFETWKQDEKQLFRIVKAGFSQRRKKLRTALAGGLNISVDSAEKLLKNANIDPNLRAQDLTIQQWCDILSRK